MNKQFLFATVITACLFQSACIKPVSDLPSTQVEPLKTAKGVANGNPVSKQIGASGGDLISADGRVKITVPAAAVSTTTEFTIQPITNTTDQSGTGPNAYRLLPEGSSFAKPVAVSFQYEAADWNGSNEDLLTVVYQKADGAWEQVPAALNKGSKTLDVSTTHFSDWQVRAAFEITSPTLFSPGQSGNLRIFGIYEQDDVLTPLNSSGWNGQVLSAGDWRILRGPGSLSAVAGETGNLLFQRKYTAPASITSIQKAEVAVTVKGKISIPDPSAAGGRRSFSEVTLLKELTIVPTNYMTGTFGTRDINFSNVLYTSGQGFAITGKSGAEEITLTIDAPPATGTFASGSFIPEDGNSKTTITLTGGPIGMMTYFSEFTTCDPANPIRYSGQVRIEAFGAIGQPVKGSFQGTMYRMTSSSGNCPQYEQIPLNIQFSTTRTM